MNKTANEVYREIDRLLSSDPQLKEAMRVFEISMEEYRKAYSGYSNPPVISTNTTSQLTFAANH